MKTTTFQEAKSEQLTIVDVDGSYLHRKQQHLLESGIRVAPLVPPSPPLTGCEVVTEDNIQTIAQKVPLVTCTSGIHNATVVAMLVCM